MRVLIALLLALGTAASGAATTMEENKALARRIFDEILTRGRFELAAELYAPGFVNHGRTRDVTLAEDQAAARGWLQAFPDLQIRPEIVLAEGDMVAVAWQARGTNSGSGNGLPATGRRIEGRGITFWRVSGGRVVEEWSEFSQLLLLQQLGIVPGGKPADDGAPFRAERAAGRTSRRERARNRDMVTSVFERIVGKGELGLFETKYARDFVNHGIRGTGGVQQEIDGTVAFRKLAPDLTVSVTRSVADGEFVGVIYTAEGTNSGAAMGYPATGKRFSVRGMSVMRVADGRIAEEWSVLDQYQALAQLGLLASKTE